MRKLLLQFGLLLAVTSAFAQLPFEVATYNAVLGGETDPILFRYTSGDSTAGATFSRTSTAYRTNSTGTLVEVAAGVLRDNHYISSNRTTLLESSKTNQLIWSSGFDNAAWLKTATTVTADTMVAPDGATTADTATTTGTTGANLFHHLTVTPNTVYTLSWWVKRGTDTELRYAFYDLTGAAFITTGTSYYAETSAAEWRKISKSVTTPAGCVNLRIYLNNTAPSISGVTTHFWGAQIEAGSFASSYIPTTAATVTRAADSLSYTLGTYPTWTRWEWFYNSAGVLTETVTTGSGSYSCTPTVDRAYRKIVIAKETRDVAYFARYK